MLKILMTSAVLLLAFSIAPAKAAPPVPPLPRYYLLDEPGLLNDHQRKAIESILIEHDDTTGEQIVVAIFNSLQGEGAYERTKQVFEEWQVGKRGEDNGALLALYEKEKLGQLISGYGLQSLDETKNGAIVRDFLLPELSAGHPYRAIGLSVFEILRAAESPLIESGRAEQLLDEGGLEGALRPVSRPMGSAVWWVLGIVGIALVSAALGHVLAAEAHFTSEGWFKPKFYSFLPLKRNSRTKRSDLNQDTGGTDGRW